MPNRNLCCDLLLWLVCLPGWLSAQNCAPVLSAPDSVCKLAPFQASVQQGTGIRVKWDACGGDLWVPGNSIGTFSLPGIANTGGVLFVQEDTLLMAFVTSRSNNKLFRLLFIQGPDSFPVVQDMGTFGNAFKGPESIAVEDSDSGSKTLVISSILPLVPPNNATDTTTLTRLFFGNSFLDTPTVSQLSVWKNRVQLPRGLTIVPRGDTLFYLQGDFGLNTIQRAWRLKNQTQFNELPSIASSGNMYDIEVLSLCDTAYLLISSSQQNPVRAWRLNGSLAGNAQPLVVDNATSPDRHASIRGVLYNQTWHLLSNLDVGVLLVSRIELYQDTVRLIDVNRSATLTNPQTNASDFVAFEGKWYACMANFFVNTAHLYRYEASCGHPFPVRISTDTTLFQGFDSTGSYILEAMYGGYTAVQRPIDVGDKPNNTLEVRGNCLNDTLRVSIDQQQHLVTSYLWSLDGQVLSTNPILSTFLSDSGAQSLMLVTANSCGIDTLLTTVLVKKKPTVLLTAPDSVCAFSPFAIGALVQVFNGPPSFLWQLGTIDSSLLPTDTFSIPTVASVPLRLTVTDSIGCTTTSQKSVVALDAPQVGFTIVTPCVGDSVLLQNTSTGTGSLSAQWCVKDSTLLANTFDFGFRAADTGLVRVALSVANTTGCTNTYSEWVRVYAKPNAGFSSADVCVGQSGSALDTSLTIDAPIVQRFWQIEDSTGMLLHTFAVVAPTFVLPTPGSYRLCLRISTPQGCTDSADRWITAYPAPVLSVFSDTVCKGDSTLFGFQSNVAQGDSILATAWQWPSLGQMSLVSAPRLLLPAGTPVVYSLQVSTALGCLVSTTDTARFLPSPITAFVVSKACDSEPLSVGTQALQGGDSLRNWQWRNPSNGALSNAIHPPFLFSSASTAQLVLSGSNVFGCIDSSLVSFAVRPRPIAAFFLEDTAPVVPATLILQNTSTGTQKYLWRLEPGQQTDTARQPTLVAIQAGPNRIQLTVRSAFACSDSAFVDFQSIAPMPKASVRQVLINSTLTTDALSSIVRNEGNVRIDQLRLRYSRNNETAFERGYLVSMLPGEAVTITEPEIALTFPQSVCAEVVSINGSMVTDTLPQCLVVSGSLAVRSSFRSGGVPVLWLFSAFSHMATVRIHSISGAQVYETMLHLREGLHLYPLTEFDPASAWYVVTLRAGADIAKAKVAWEP